MSNPFQRVEQKQKPGGMWLSDSSHLNIPDGLPCVISSAPGSQDGTFPPLLLAFLPRRAWFWSLPVAVSPGHGGAGRIPGAEELVPMTVCFLTSKGHRQMSERMHTATKSGWVARVRGALVAPQHWGVRRVGGTRRPHQPPSAGWPDPVPGDPRATRQHPAWGRLVFRGEPHRVFTPPREGLCPLRLGRLGEKKRARESFLPGKSCPASGQRGRREVVRAARGGGSAGRCGAEPLPVRAAGRSGGGREGKRVQPPPLPALPCPPARRGVERSGGAWRGGRARGCPRGQGRQGRAGSARPPAGMSPRGAAR